MVRIASLLALPLLPLALGRIALRAPSEPGHGTNSNVTRDVTWIARDDDPERFDLFLGDTENPFNRYALLAKDVATADKKVTVKIPFLPSADNYIYRAVAPGEIWFIGESQPFQLVPE